MTRYRVSTTHEHYYNQLKVGARGFLGCSAIGAIWALPRRPFLNKGSKTALDVLRVLEHAGDRGERRAGDPDPHDGPNAATPAFRPSRLPECRSGLGEG